MIHFRNRFTIGLGMLIFIVLIGVIFLVGELFKNFYINTFTDRIEREAEYVSSVVVDRMLSKEEIEKELMNAGKHLNSRIILISNEGSLVADSDHSQEILSELKGIPEFRDILVDGKKIRKSFSVVNEETGSIYFTQPVLDNGKLVHYVIVGLSDRSLENLTNKIWGILFTSIGLAFIIIITIGYRMTNHYTKPIEDATRVANELARGNYSARTYEDRSRETGMLSQSINILARNLQHVTWSHEMQKDRLKALIENIGSGVLLIDERGYISLVNKSYKEIFDFGDEELRFRLYYDVILYKEVIQMIEDIFLAERQIQKHLQLPLKIERRDFEVYGAPIIGTNEEWKGVLLVFHDITDLKQLEQMRKDFVANVSHELKTPITSIKGFTETLLDGAMNDQETCEYFLNIILKESDRMQSLINDLLDLSKIEQEQFKLNITKVDLSELLEEVIVILRAKAESKEIELDTNMIDNAMVTGDSFRLKQVLINLISNAIAYTQAGGKVIVELIDEGDQIVTRISDTGIGISPKEIPRIFERFYRVDKARSRNSGGTGLGLAIVKHLVEAHKGKIDVKSKLGEGTTFIVTLKK